MTHAPFVGTLFVRRRNPVVYALGTFPMAFVALALLAPHAPWSAPVVACGIALSIVLSLALHAKNPWPRLHETTVRADRTALTLADETIPTAAIKNAFIVPSSHGVTVVRVERSLRPHTDVVVIDADEGRRVLRGLGFDASQRVATFRGTSRMFASWWVGALALAGGSMTALSIPALVAHVSPNLGVALAFAVMAVTSALALIPSRIDVGADGIVVTWLGRRRFIACGEIDWVSSYVDGFGNSRLMGVELTLKSSEVVKLPIGQERWGDDRTSIVVERINEAVDTHGGGGYDDAAALLGRNDQSLAAWIHTLRATGAGANATLRIAPVDPVRLWRVLESPRARLEDRAAAAVALSGALDDDAKARLRGAAEAIADPRLRVAVEAVTGDDDEALEAALGEISPAVGRAR